MDRPIPTLTITEDQLRYILWDMDEHVINGTPITYSPIAREDDRCRHCFLKREDHRFFDQPNDRCNRFVLRALWNFYQPGLIG